MFIRCFHLSQIVGPFMNNPYSLFGDYSPNVMVCMFALVCICVCACRLSVVTV